MSTHTGRGHAGAGGAPDGDDVTRYLCAGAYVDSGFAADVVDELVRARTRGVAPAPGIDVPAVVRHSLAALHRATRRDLLLTLIVVGVALLAGVQGMLIAVWLFAWALVARALRSLGRGELGGAFAQLGVFLLISIACLLGLMLRSDQPLLGAGAMSVRLPLESTQVLGLVIAALWIVNYLDRVFTYGTLAEALSRFAFSPAAAPAEAERWHDRLGYLEAAAGSPLSVYSQEAPNAPFAGFGPVVHTWSVSCPLQPSSGRSAPVRPLSNQEIYAALMSAGSAAEFVVGEVVLVPGWLPPDHPFLDPDRQRPVPGLPPAIVQDIADRPGGPESYHLIWTSAAPAAGLVAHGFVQALVQDNQLTVDAAFTVLPPVDARCREADRYGHAGPLTMARLLGASLLDVGRRTPQAPLNLARSAVRLWSRRGENVGSAGHFATGASQDHGARAGVRELAARHIGGANLMNDYAATRHVNLLSRELARAIGGLLSERGFDSSLFAHAVDPVWQKPLTPGTRGRVGPGVRVP